VNVYVTPPVSPDTAVLRLEPPTALVRPPGEEVTVYMVMGLPPSDAGADHEIVADRFPSVAVTLVGGPGGVRYAKTSAGLTMLLPPALVTVKSTAPPAPAGLTAVTCVSDTKWKLVAAVAPNLTPVTPVNLHPLMVTVVPPDAGPDAGTIEVTAGATLHAGPIGPTVNDHVYGTRLTVSATTYVTPL
jgi:hypothetical protein